MSLIAAINVAHLSAVLNGNRRSRDNDWVISAFFGVPLQLSVAKRSTNSRKIQHHGVDVAPSSAKHARLTPKADGATSLGLCELRLEDLWRQSSAVDAQCACGVNAVMQK
jgi:hypothetical protein